MPAQAVEPLRISKTTPSNSPYKMNASSRPLSEISPMERRRNSPSFKQNGKLMSNGDSSPFDPSPFNVSNSSPLLFWKSKDPGSSPSRLNCENNPNGRDEPSSPTRRSSIENLKKASRVKNSNMFAREALHEYDPTSAPIVERPLASGRPLTMQSQGNAHGARGTDSSRGSLGHRRTDSEINLPVYSPTRSPLRNNGTSIASKDRASPTKSSLSSAARFTGHTRQLDNETGSFSDDETSAEHQLPPGRSLHRHAKSVTFDVAPPQINEYEMTTPDLSSVGTVSREGSYDSTQDDEDDSFALGNSIDRDDSFDASLEDTAKTPVVLPEDWRHMSPATASGVLVEMSDDVFSARNGSPMPDAQPGTARSSETRSDSPDRRPLPPLPALGNIMSKARSDSASSANLSPNSQRTLRAAPTVSKAELQSMSGNRMSLEERLRLMMIQDQPTEKAAADDQRERRLRRGGPQSSNIEEKASSKGFADISIHEDESATNLPVLNGGYKFPPRISRESILRKVKGQTKPVNDMDVIYSSPPPSSSPDRALPLGLDPDMPLPSTEEFDDSVIIKREPEDGDEGLDVYSIPEMYNSDRPESRIDEYDYDGEESVIHHKLPENDEQDPEKEALQQLRTRLEDGQSTPRATSPAIVAASLQSSQPSPKLSSRMSLPDFGMSADADCGLGLQSYMTPSPPVPENNEFTRASSPQITAMRDFLNRQVTPEAQMEPISPAEEERSSTPDSVIRHSDSDLSQSKDMLSVPEQVATVKAAGTKLKTRPSLTPADMHVMAATRRQVSGQISAGAKDPLRTRQVSSASFEPDDDTKGLDNVEAQPARRNGLMKLDLSVIEDEDDLSFGIDREFDRISEAQKRGYLMRQNTKVVVASSNNDEVAVTSSDESGKPGARGTRSAGCSPRKSAGESWSTEPWNGKMRRKSGVDGSSGSPTRNLFDGPVPPLPGMESNARGLLEPSSVDEVPSQGEVTEQTERGRLFVRVVGVKNLSLPLPKMEKTQFALCLDNGVHCVTTQYLELGKTAPIGQEFELVVQEDLEFQLTLQTKKLEPPPPEKVLFPPSPTRSPVKPKQSTFSRVFQSPKKRKELDRKYQEEEARAARQRQESRLFKPNAPQTAWELLHNLVGKDGSFGRAYIALSEHEQYAFGRRYDVDIPLFNEWAVEEVTSSVKSKSSSKEIRNRPPYKVGSLSLQLLYVPRPKGATDDDLPKSMTACLREMEDAEESATSYFEGHLSQQGGDCPYWRRRFFKLEGSKLTAYHEATHQPRANINLANAAKLIDDKSAVTHKKPGGRRKSAFAEEDGAYMFVEEGFRIRFANGEVIDFYADTNGEKMEWMKALGQVIGKDTSTVGWTGLVLARERAAASAAKARTQPSPRKAIPVPTSVTPSKAAVPPPVEKSPRHQAPAARQGKVLHSAMRPKSMLF